MSISHRNRRALVLEVHDAGSAGNVDTTYLVKSSGDADDRWWCSVGVPSGREVTTGMQPDHRVEAVLGFAAECPVTVDDAIEVDGASYAVRAVLPRDYGRDDLQVLCERVAELALTT